MMEPVAVDSMVRIMNKSSHPGVWRMTKRVYSLSKEHIQEKTVKEIISPKRVDRRLRRGTVV
jgi:ribosomal protein L20A (L18A)